MQSLQVSVFTIDVSESMQINHVLALTHVCCPHQKWIIWPNLLCSEDRITGFLCLFCQTASMTDISERDMNNESYTTNPYLSPLQRTVMGNRQWSMGEQYTLPMASVLPSPALSMTSPSVETPLSTSISPISPPRSRLRSEMIDFHTGTNSLVAVTLDPK